MTAKVLKYGGEDSFYCPITQWGIISSQIKNARIV
jgi:hypothetical protein